MRLHRSYAVALACLLVGCYYYRVDVPDSAAAPATTLYEGEVVWSLAWGLAQEVPDVKCFVPLNPQTPGAPADTLHLPVAEVRVSSNFAFTLLTVVTLGFVAPAKVEWKCAKPQMQGSTITIPPIPPPPADSR